MLRSTPLYLCLDDVEEDRMGKEAMTWKKRGERRRPGGGAGGGGKPVVQGCFGLVLVYISTNDALSYFLIGEASAPP